MLPAAALDAGLQRRLAAELEAAVQLGAIAPEIESGVDCRDDHGHPHHVSEVAARCRDDVSVKLPTRPRQLVMATDGTIGPPERSPKGLFRLAHNRE